MGKPTKSPKIALVHDWLTNLGGAERTARALVDAFPEADLYTSVYDPNGLDLFRGLKVRTTWLQKIPGRLKFKHQLWAPLRPLAFRSLNLRQYDIVISSSSAESKQVRVRPGATHICYCHTPIRYFWINPETYIKAPGLGPLSFLAPLIVPLFLRPLRWLDYRAAQRVDVFIANSRAVQNRIKQHYQRSAEVIYPPVQVGRFRPASKRADFFVTAGRQVAYKRHDLAIEACSQLGLPLLVLGNGPEHERLKQLAGPTVEFNPSPTDQDIEKAFAQARAFIHPGEEDFGITSIEAMAAGCPIIAYQAGGALDYVQPGVTGEFFDRQALPSLVATLKGWRDDYSVKQLTAAASLYSSQNFARQLQALVAKYTAN